ncbi:MAG: hypothetical protein IKV48_04310 [Eggerthellaceae bacterium]|nr:hypothetical protein [Eggerthellaceae bacterium]
MPNYGLLIDYEYCSGCHSCEVACKEEHGFPVGKHGIRVMNEGPWQINNRKTNWNKIPIPTDLCDLCADRLAKGKKPTCVHHCLAQVMKFGTIDELCEDLKRKHKQVLWVPREGEPLDWQEEIDTTSVVDKVKGAGAGIQYSVADDSALQGGEKNTSFKLALQREEQKLDDRQKVE